VLDLPIWLGLLAAGSTLDEGCVLFYFKKNVLEGGGRAK
jgi:hypothetical protein